MNTAVKDERVRSVTGILELNERRCGTIKEATDEMHRLMAAVRLTGKKGKITITMEVAPDKNDELALTIAQTVSTTIPKADVKKAVMYHDPENLAFTKTDPRQLELLAEQEAERAEKAAELHDKGIAQIGRGIIAPATAAAV